MTSFKNIVLAATLSVLSISAAHAGQTMKPLQGVSFHVGTKHAVGYFLRLRDALAEDFKTVRAVLGDDGFEKLARAYLAKHPSKHPSLNRLGDAFPRFLAGPVKVKKKALLRDVARVEVTMQEVFDAPRSEPLDTTAFAKIPPEAWEKAKLRLTPALRLLALGHRVNPLITAVRKEEPLPAAPRGKAWMAVYRKDFAVWRMDLTEPMYAVLSALEKGARLSDAIAASGIEDPSRVFAWFQDWRAEGFFSGIGKKLKGIFR